MAIDRASLTFVEGELDDPPPFRIACTTCLNNEGDRERCNDCGGKGELLAPWVEELVEIFEREGIARRV